MKGKKKGNPSLSELVSRFSRFDVIAEMEKEYQTFSPKSLPLSLIDDNQYIKRVRFSKSRLESLGKSIAEKGIYSPLVVRRKGNHYELILGRKRYYGAKEAKLPSVPVVVADLQDEEMLLVLLADTRDQRESNILERAYLYRALSTKFRYSQQTLAQLSHESRSQVTNTMRLLSLPEPILKEVMQGELSFGHARALLSLSEEEILKVSARIHKENLSVRETERLVRSLSGFSSRQGPAMSLNGKRVILSFESEEEAKDYFDKRRP